MTRTATEAPVGYTIRAASPQDIAHLPGIERAAAERFAGLPGLMPAVLADSTSIADFSYAQREGLLWTAAAAHDGSPVGFAMVELLDGNAHLDELDVHPDHGRRGVGAALVRTVCDWARDRGFPAVTLTTYRHVPWNAPFYSRLGFRILRSDELTAGLAALVRSEAAAGLRAEDRAVMRFETGHGPGPWRRP
jgi:GNAT superfamily N-acetyltransferase